MVAALVAWLLTGKQNVGWSVAYGALAVLVPAAVFADSDWVMALLARPAAGPSVAVNVPSYDRNCTTAPPASTSASPSGAPFWMPVAATVAVPKPPH